MLETIAIAITLTEQSNPILEKTETAIVEVAQPEPPKEILYTIQQGDILEKIALNHNTTTQRLYDKNLHINEPNVIQAGQQLNIPLPNEHLVHRAFPVIEAAVEPVRVPQEVASRPVVARPKARTNVTPKSQPSSVQKTGGLTGSKGSVRHGGNCVNEPGVNNPGRGNPITWPVLTQTPRIGGTVLFTYNHTGVITGIWDNGDLEIRHQNFSGTRTRFTRAEFRGFR